MYSQFMMHGQKNIKIFYGFALTCIKVYEGNSIPTHVHFLYVLLPHQRHARSKT